MTRAVTKCKHRRLHDSRNGESTISDESMRQWRLLQNAGSVRVGARPGCGALRRAVLRSRSCDVQILLREGVVEDLQTITRGDTCSM